MKPNDIIKYCLHNLPDTTFEQLKPLIQEAYEYAKEKYSKRKLER